MVTIEKIQRVVAQTYDITVGLMRGPMRHDTVSIPRHLAMYLCRRCLLGFKERSTGVQKPLSYAKIGAAFGGRDHSTVFNACERVETLRKQGVISDSTLQKILDQLWNNTPQVDDYAVYPTNLITPDNTEERANA